MVKRVDKGERRERTAEALRMVRLGGYGDRKPSQLSGGQRQRVALARAIVNRPKVLLLDEPLGALDLKLRQEMQIELKAIQREVGITFVYVTHDQEEALTMSDRLAVFNEGRIEQVGPPAEVYEHPQSEFIAGFVGVSNVLERDGRRYTVRPEKINLLGAGEQPEAGAHVEAGLVRDVQYVGPVTRYHVTLDRGGELQVLAQNLDEGSSEVLEARGASRARRVAAGAGVGHRRIGGRIRMRTEAHGRAGPGSACWSPRSASWPPDAAAAERRRREHRDRGPRLVARRDQGEREEEGQVNLVIWAGYADKSWADTFTKQTGCKVNTKDGASSDDMVDLMSTGAYDGVSASGDATLRLIAQGDVAPVNFDLIPNYADVYEGLKGQSYNTVDGVGYGVPHGRGPNLMVWKHGDLAEQRRAGRRSGRARSYKGKLSIYDNQIFIADAAIYLKATQPDLNITNPYELDDDQFNAAVDLLKQQRPNIGEYWDGVTYAKQVTSFKSGETVVGTTWQYR